MAVAPGPDTIGVVLHPVNQPGIPDRLAAVAGIELVAPSDEDGVIAALQSASVLVTRRWRTDFLTPSLRWVQSVSSGVDQFPLNHLRDNGIVLTRAGGVHTAVAEHAIGLLLCLVRDLPAARRSPPQRTWDPHVAAELGGRTVVIAGLGPIGEAVAARLAGWEVTVIGVTRRPAAYRGSLSDVRPLAKLAEACLGASALIVTLPLTPQTEHLVSDDVLEALSGGWLVNVGRGHIVDEAALIRRLEDGRLGGAGLDVIEIEPPPVTSPLWELPNVVLTPHMAGMSNGYPARLGALFADNLQAYRGAGDWRFRVC